MQLKEAFGELAWIVWRIAQSEESRRAVSRLEQRVNSEGLQTGPPPPPTTAAGVEAETAGPPPGFAACCMHLFRHPIVWVWAIHLPDGGPAVAIRRAAKVFRVDVEEVKKTLREELKLD